MIDDQKNIIDRLLKEKQKTKRNLAKFLEVKENGINRILKNPNISIRKLEKIAEFLEMDTTELLQMKNSMRLQEAPVEYHSLRNKKEDISSAQANLTEIIKIQGKTIETMAETERTLSKNFDNLLKLLKEKGEYSLSNK